MNYHPPPTRSFDVDGFLGYLDDETQIARVAYPEHLTPQVTIDMYAWFDELASQVGITSLKGCIFDFCNVKQFHPGNARAAQRESKKINSKYDLRRFPVAFLVRNMSQEQMLRVSMRLTQNSDRLRIIHNESQAVEYIQEWHRINTVNPTEQ